MASSKKPRKKRNKTATIHQFNNLVEQNSFIVTLEATEEKMLLINGRGYPLPRDLNKMRRLHKTQESKMLAFFFMPHKWTFVIGAYLRDEQGNFYIEYDSAATSNRLSLEDVEKDGFIYEELKANRERINQEHLLTQFVLSIPIVDKESDLNFDRTVMGIAEKFLVEERLKNILEVREMVKKGNEELAQINPLDYGGNKQIWGILAKSGIYNYADIRNYASKHNSKPKGVGDKRLEILQEEYQTLINIPEVQEKIPTQIAFHQQLELNRQLTQREVFH